MKRRMESPAPESGPARLTKHGNITENPARIPTTMHSASEITERVNDRLGLVGPSQYQSLG